MMSTGKSIRKVHIDNQEWVWVCNSNRYRYTDEIRIYSPSKKMTRVDIDDFFNEEIVEDVNPGQITPSLIKSYIEKNLLTTS